MKNTHIHKKVIATIVFLIFILNSSILLVQISPVAAQDPAASLTGTISDQALDTDGDGISNELVIGVEVNVTTAGTFEIEISELSDSSSNIIDVSNRNSTFLDSGVQFVYISLNGENIYASKTNPEEISKINLFDESESLLDTLSDVSIPVDYYYVDFGVSPAYLTGTILDESVDINGDGIYENLLVEVEVNVIEAGTFTVELVKLYDATPSIVDISGQNSTSLDVGVHNVQVLLDGSIIYMSGLNPDTVAIIALYDESGTTIDERFDISLSKTYSFIDFQHVSSVISYDEIQREIVLEQEGKIHVVNDYSITNLGFLATTIDIAFPESAHDFQVRDAMGSLEKTTENGKLTITLRDSIDVDQTETLHIIYDLPWGNHITHQNGKDYTLSFSFSEQINSSIKTLKLSIILPEGAIFKSSVGVEPERIEEINNQKTLIFSFSNVSPSDEPNFEIKYEYNIFWGSFYPTIWVGILVVVASAIFYFWGTPKIISAPSIQVPLKDLRSFVNTYEEKTTIQSELQSLEERLQKGKIPRRRYKVRKKMLDGRFSTICRNLSTLRSSIRASGSKYASLMSQLEVAEAKLEGAERDMQRVKSRYGRGEVSKSAYRKLLEEYQRQIEEAEATIDGVLLRLRD